MRTDALAELSKRIQFQHNRYGECATTVNGYDCNGNLLPEVQPITIYSNQEVITLEQFNLALQLAVNTLLLGAKASLQSAVFKVVVGISDTLGIPPNNRHTTIDMREGHQRIIGQDILGNNLYASVETGDPGDQYYEFPRPDQIDLQEYVGNARQLEYLLRIGERECKRLGLETYDQVMKKMARRARRANQRHHLKHRPIADDS